MDIASHLIEYPKWEEIELPEEVSEEGSDKEVEDGRKEGPLSAFAGDQGDQPNEERVICAVGHGALKSNVELAMLGGGFTTTDSSLPANVIVKQAKKAVEDTVLRAGVLPATLVITGLLLTSISENILQDTL
jgi:hypothetical protein